MNDQVAHNVSTAITREYLDALRARHADREYLDALRARHADHDQDRHCDECGEAFPCDLAVTAAALRRILDEFGVTHD